MVVVLEEKIPASKPKKKTSRKKKAKSVPEVSIPPIKKVKMAIHNPHISISKSVAGASIAITALVVAITPSNAWILGPVIGAMAIFGIAMGYFSSK